MASNLQDEWRYVRESLFCMGVRIVDGCGAFAAAHHHVYNVNFCSKFHMIFLLFVVYKLAPFEPQNVTLRKALCFLHILHISLKNWLVFPKYKSDKIEKIWLPYVVSRFIPLERSLKGDKIEFYFGADLG